MIPSYRVIKKPVDLDIVVFNIVEEIDAEDVATTKNPEKGSTYHGCEVDISLDEMDVSAIQSQSLKPNQDDSTFSKKEKRKDF
ncbi:hypothetical protein PVK06_044182 [Gossypium arboreum]|uniref:Uncharacterized protein n=1 Tax=Gossypium arboreum TaxID=29729 RepID=A0ABR0MQZ4_GOSAR|nr:hypothetical protein PVK06_044182 [Gossypium arboreum]